MDRPLNAEHVLRKGIGNPIADRLAAIGNYIQGPSVRIIKDRSFVDRTPGFSLEFVTKKLNIAYRKALTINGVVDVQASSFSLLCDRGTLE